MQVEGRKSGDRVTVDYDTKGGVDSLTLRLGQVVDQWLIDRLTEVADYRTNAWRTPMTYAEAAAVLGVSTKTLQRRVAAGSIGYTLVGKRVRFLPEHLRGPVRDTPLAHQASRRVQNGRHGAAPDGR